MRKSQTTKPPDYNRPLNKFNKLFLTFQNVFTQGYQPTALQSGNFLWGILCL